MILGGGLLGIFNICIENADCEHSVKECDAVKGDIGPITGVQGLKHLRIEVKTRKGGNQPRPIEIIQIKPVFT